MPQAAAPPGASAAVVPGAKPRIVKSNGAVVLIVPGTKKTTASIASFAYDGAAASYRPSLQHCVSKL